MHLAIDSIVEIFENKYEVDCEISINASGILTTQLLNGAPFNIFLSADMKYPKAIYEAGLSTKPVIYAKGKLILVADKKLGMTSIADVLKNAKRIAIADENLAPYGKSAVNFLKDEDYYSIVEHKLVMAESIGQVNQFLKSKAVDIGFTSATFRQENSQAFDYFDVALQKENQIEQGMVVLNSDDSAIQTHAELFADFMQTTTVKNILLHFNYDIN